MPDLDSHTKEAWRDAFLRMWFDIQDEGRDPAELIASWTDRKKTTAYAWKNAKCTPSDPWMLMRLAHSASKAGYDHLIDVQLPASKRVRTGDDDLLVTHRVEDNEREAMTILVEYWNAYEAGRATLAEDKAHELEIEAREMQQEARTLLDK